VRKPRFGRKGIKVNDHGTRGNPAWLGNSLSGPELDKWKSMKAKIWRQGFNFGAEVSGNKCKNVVTEEEYVDWTWEFDDTEEKDWEKVRADDEEYFGSLIEHGTRTSDDVNYFKIIPGGYMPKSGKRGGVHASFESYRVSG
jgi:hypothetical protein